MSNYESESIERMALQDLHDAADNKDIKTLGLVQQNLDSAFVSIANQLPPSAIVINRTIGIGIDTNASEKDIRSIVSLYRENLVTRYFVQIHPDHQPESIVEWLSGEGLKAGRGWQKFEWERAPVVPSKSDLTVREIDQRYGEDFGRIVCNAFDLGDQAYTWLAKLTNRPDWHVFMCFDGDAPAGTGALYVKNGYAWLDYHATAPEFRSRGCQGAIIKASLNRAIETGCAKAYTCTGVSVPGESQHSYNNILRAGFVQTYVRENFEPA